MSDTTAKFADIHPRRETAIAAAELYARCHWHGVTPRSGNVCLIAVSAIEFSRPLLQSNHDFERISSVDKRLKLVRTD